MIAIGPDGKRGHSFTTKRLEGNLELFYPRSKIVLSCDVLRCVKPAVHSTSNLRGSSRVYATCVPIRPYSVYRRASIALTGSPVKPLEKCQ